MGAGCWGAQAGLEYTEDGTQEPTIATSKLIESKSSRGITFASICKPMQKMSRCISLYGASMRPSAGTWYQSLSSIRSHCLHRVKVDKWHHVKLDRRYCKFDPCQSLQVVLTVDIVRVGTYALLPNASMTSRSLIPLQGDVSENEELMKMSGLMIYVSPYCCRFNALTEQAVLLAVGHSTSEAFSIEITLAPPVFASRCLPCGHGSEELACTAGMVSLCRQGEASTYTH